MPQPAKQPPVEPSPPSLFDRLLDRADPLRVLRFLLRPETRWAICWLIALGSGGFLAMQAWMSFDNPKRAAGHWNWGHATIDFGGQWIMGRTIVEGHGRQLYNRTYLRSLTASHYPDGVEDPKEERTDTEALLAWMAGADDDKAPRAVASCLGPLAAANGYEEAVLLARGREVWTAEEIEHVTAPQVGGALYPPIHALLYAPLALLPPPLAYRVAQALILALVFFDGWLVQRMTGGRIWWPVATVLLMVFPGLVGCLDLGQNGLFSLTVVLLGWWQLMRGRETWAGVCWGLLAFKPVWAAAFFLVPLLTRRWRMAASMAVAGVVQIALTLPVVGWRTWLDWLQVGHMAANDYLRQKNWIFLSRDLLGIPRRWLLDFEGSVAKDVEKHPLPTILGWSLWTAVLLVTLFVVWRRPRRMKALSGPAASFVLIGAFFSCYHFMYYDLLLAGLPVLLLFMEPRRYLQAMFWRCQPSAEQRAYYQPTVDDLTPPPLPLMPDGRRPRWVRAPVPPLLLLVMIVTPAIGSMLDPSYHYPPVDTFALLLLWAWCGYRVLTDPEEDIPSPVPAGVAVDGVVRAAEFAEFAADVGGAHERFADQHGTDAGRL
jgi:hypothetical protein